MYIYFLMFFVAFAYHLFAYGNKRKSNFILGFIFSYLALFIGLGDMIGGYDRYIYGEMFDFIADNVHGLSDIPNLLFLINGMEYGYFVWELLISLFTRNRYIFILITTMFMYVLYYRAFKLYMKDYPMACIVFMGLFVYFTMTYLRQTLAVGIMWQGFKYIWERKPIRYVGITLLAASFHNSAFVALPLYFFSLHKYGKQVIFTALGLSLLLGLTPLPELLISNTGEVMNMSERTESYAGAEMVGFRFDYLLESVVFIGLIFWNFKKFQIDKKTLTFLNMSVYFCCIILFFVRFGQGGRFGWYFFLGYMYIFSELSRDRFVSMLFRPLVLVMMFTLFLRVTMAWESAIFPYKTFLTPGEPSGDGNVYERYEYDKNYTINKLYR